MKFETLFHVAISLAFTVVFFILWPTNLIWDDAGIILKYMDNFESGYFYCYNPADGPIFGISSFLHGIFAGFLAYSHICSPLNSLFVSNFVGIFLVSFLSFKMLSLYEKNRGVILTAWLFLMLSSQDFICNMKQGMETPLQIAAIMGCLYFYQRNDAKWMSLLCVLAILSKLDTIPIVCSLYIAFIFNNRRLLSPLTIKNKTVQDIIRYGFLPLILWIILSCVIFNGPLPQSALAKLYYHPHSSGSWFPFLQPLTKNLIHKMVLLGLAALFLGYGIYCALARRVVETFTSLIFGLSAAAYLLLYYFYNPGERMGWYYALPEFLISLQVIVIIIKLGERFQIKHKSAALITIFISLSIFSLSIVLRHIDWTTNYLRIIETERMAVGTWIQEHSNPGDTLLAGHGHIARNSGLYTIDFTGINSKIATDYKLDFARLVKIFRPRWIVKQGLLDENIQNGEGYNLKRSFFNNSILHYAPMRIYERTNADDRTTEYPMNQNMIQTDGKLENIDNGSLTVEGSVIHFHHFNEHKRLSRFILGLIRGEKDQVVNARILANTSKVLRDTVFTLAKRDLRNPPEGYTDTWEIELDLQWETEMIVLSSKEPDTNLPAPVKVVDPVMIGIIRR
jgi:hypothetical protein